MKKFRNAFLIPRWKYWLRWREIQTQLPPNWPNHLPSFHDFYNKKTRIVFFVFHFEQLLFFLNECPGFFVRHRPGHSLVKKINLLKMKNEKTSYFWGVCLECATTKSQKPDSTWVFLGTQNDQVVVGRYHLPCPIRRLIYGVVRNGILQWGRCGGHTNGVEDEI